MQHINNYTKKELYELADRLQKVVNGLTKMNEGLRNDLTENSSIHIKNSISLQSRVDGLEYETEKITQESLIRKWRIANLETTIHTLISII